MDTTNTGVDPLRARRDWRQARRALRRLIEDSSRTEEVFEIIDALAGPSDSATERRFRAEPAGLRLLEERPSLLATLRDRASLLNLPQGTLGRSYSEFMTTGGLDADALEAADRGRFPPQPSDDETDQWIGERLRDAHDLWHVVSGYGMDEAGEVALLAFTHAQIGNLGIAFIVAAAAVLGPRDWRLSWLRYLWRAWRRGRRARWLAVVPWEDWLARPLVCVRRDLDIEPPEQAHRGGILVGGRAHVFGASSIATQEV